MRALLAMLIAVALSGCSVAVEGVGSASIYVKDAVTDDFDELHVVFTEVRVHVAGNESDDESDDGSWQILWQNETGQDVDLLNASGDLAVFLGEADLEAGKYTQIRIDATEAYGIKDGQRIDITLSNNQLKVVKSFDIEADQETRIVLDFDLERSLHQQGNGVWRMTPVIGKVFTEIVDDDESGEDTTQEGEVVEIEGSGA